MALRTPEAPEEEKSRIDEHYDEVLSPLERERLSAVRERHKDEIDSRNLKNDEEKAGNASGDSKAGSDIRDQEEKAGGWRTKYEAGDRTNTLPQKFGWKTIVNKKNGPIGMIIGLLAVMIFGFSATAPAFLLVHLGEIITNKFNIQEASLNSRADKILAKQLSSGATKGLCTAATKALCGYDGISKRQKDIFEKGGVKVNGKEGLFGRFKPSSFEIEGKPPIRAADFRKEILRNPQLREVSKQAYNPRFASIADKLAAGVFANFKTSRANPFKDKAATDEERDEIVKKTVNEGDQGGTVGKKYDFDEEKQQYVDESGNVVDKATAEAHNARVDVEGGLKEGIEDVVKNGDKVGDDVLKEAEASLKGGGALDKVKGFFSVASVADAGCSINGAMQAVSYGAKVIRAVQMARYAMIFLSTASMIKAGDATPEDVAYLGNILTKTVSISSIDDSGKAITTTTKAATDSYGFRYAAYGDTGPLSSSASQYLSGGGMGGKLASTYSTILGYLGGKKHVNEVCHVVKNPFVQTGSLIIGVVATIFTGGVGAVFLEGAKGVITTTILSAVGTVLMGYLQDMIAGVLIDNNTFGELAGDAITSGSGALLSSIGGVGGNAPLHPEEAVAYNAVQQEVLARNAAEDRATHSPLDPSNPNTFMGKIVFQLLPLSGQMSSASSILTTPVSVVSRSLSTILTPSVMASDTIDDYTQCQDMDYRDLNLATDPFCNPIRGIPPQYLNNTNSDPESVASRLFEKGYINGETGAPQGDYAKFVTECIDRKDPLGYSGEDSQTNNGSDCFIDNQDKADYYLYRIDTRVINGMDEGYDTGTGDCAPLSTSATTATGTTTTASTAKVSEDQLKSLITSYNLPPPTENGDDGYKKLLDKLTQNPNAAWAAKSMLAGEKNFKSKGGEVKEYLNTAWVWFETGQDAGPDPYQVNCNDDRPGYTSEVSFFCGVTNFQSSGYQAENRKGDYIEMFKKFYSDSELTAVMQQVVANSSKASNSKWNYNDPSQQKGLVSSYLGQVSSASLSDISPNKSFSDQKGQFLTLLLGKDPNISTALNSFAVSDGDLINALKGSGYGYIHGPEKQLLSNMIMALYMLDDGATGNLGGCLASIAGSAAGAGIAAIFGSAGIPEITQPYGPTDFSAGNPMYDYATEYGMNPPGHTGVDYGIGLDGKLYSPVDGVVQIAGGTPYFRSTDRLDGSGNSLPGTGELLIQLANGDQLVLGHMHQIVVKVGDHVTAGQYVGLSGQENGPHVHVEYRKPDTTTTSGFRLVDPRTVL